MDGRETVEGEMPETRAMFPTTMGVPRAAGSYHARRVASCHNIAAKLLSH